MRSHANELHFLDLRPQGPWNAAIVWLHGLGADGHDFAPFFSQSAWLPPETRVLLPHAPFRSVTLNMGFTMRAWYDIRNADLSAEPDRPGIQDSAARLGAFLKDLEEQGLDSHRIVLGGFSQGGVMALWTGLSYPRPLAGMAALSAYLPEDPPIEPIQRDSPLWLAHGRDDSLIPLALGTAMRDRLRRLGAQALEWREYPVDHGVSEAEINDLGRWLQGRLG